MSLIVAKKLTTGGIHIVSDSRVTPGEIQVRTGGPTPLSDRVANTTDLDSCLKCVILSPFYCVCFAGKIDLAQHALNSLITTKSLERDLMNSHLFEQHRAQNQEVDYIIATAGIPSTIDRVSGGRLERDLVTAWIGDHEAFESYQSHYHKSEEDRATVNWGGVLVRNERSSMRDALGAVINGNSHRTVGNFILVVSSARSGVFRYLPSLTGNDFHPVANTTEETSLLRSVGISGGSYNFTILPAKSPGIGALGAYFLELQLGLFFYPQHTWQPIRFSQITCEDFIRAVQNEHHVTLEGFSFS
jgi:hypothetical protein